MTSLWRFQYSSWKSNYVKRHGSMTQHIKCNLKVNFMLFDNPCPRWSNVLPAYHCFERSVSFLLLLLLSKDWSWLPNNSLRYLMDRMKTQEIEVVCVCCRRVRWKWTAALRYWVTPAWAHKQLDKNRKKKKDEDRQQDEGRQVDRQRPNRRTNRQVRQTGWQKIYRLKPREQSYWRETEKGSNMRNVNTEEYANETKVRTGKKQQNGKIVWMKKKTT